MSARCGLAALATLVRRSTGSLAPSAGAAGSDLCQTSTAVLYGVARLSTSASSGSIDRKDVLFNLDNGADPEAAAAIRAYQREAFAAAAKPGTAAAAAEPALPLTERVQRKYAAAAIVETGIQSVSLPLSWDADGTDGASVKRYVAQLSAVGAAAGFAAPAAELDARLTEAAAGVDSAKELLLRMRPYTTPDFHAGLMDALAATEAETGAAVSLDGTSPGYRKFADKVKVRRPWMIILAMAPIAAAAAAPVAAPVAATADAQCLLLQLHDTSVLPVPTPPVQALAQTHKLPWQMLLPVKQKLSTADEATADKLQKDYTTWLQSAAVAGACARSAAQKRTAQNTPAQDTTKQDTLMPPLPASFELQRSSA